MLYPFYFNNPFFTFGFPFPNLRRTNIPTLDKRGIYEVCTTGIAENSGSSESASIDYGINPNVWKSLPNQSVILWKVRHTVNDSNSSVPVNVVIPNSGSSTVANSGSTGTSKIPVVDNKGTQVHGNDVSVPNGASAGSNQIQLGNTTEHIVYIDKCAGIFRLLGITAQNSPASSATTGNTDTPES